VFAPKNRTRALAGLFAASLATVLWIAAGSAGLLYLPLYALAALPGLPLGFVLFGSRHAAGWIGGALLGYGLTQLALWVAIASGVGSGATALVAWVALSAATFSLARVIGPGPAVEMPQWTGADSRALLIVLLLVPAVMGPPYRNLGRADESGTRYYRAYFTADFVWHSALAYELGKFSLPPRNPYMAPRAMNYYWAYFLLPATVAKTAPIEPLRDVEACLKANAISSGVLMIGALFLLVRTAASRPAPAAVAVALTVLAASAEGAYEIRTLLATGRPLSSLLDTNIDAITAWRFWGLRVDNIPRSLWYTPQHTTSIALGLIGLLVAALAGAPARVAAIAGAGIALGLATMLNPLLGAVCAALYGACVLADGLRQPRGWMLVPRHAIAAVPVALAVAAGAASRVTEGAGSALDIGFSGFSRNYPLTTLMLSLGPVLVPAVAGLMRCRADRRPVTIAVSGILLGLFLLYFVRISEASWVGFRAGQILLVTIPILLACLFTRLRTVPAALLAAAILAIGLPTTLVDTWNAQDISNQRQTPDFRWTIVVTPAQQQAFRWLRANTPEDAIVQMEPMLRGREHWTLIPSFAGRRMAAGLPISLLPLPEYRERSERVRTLFATENVEEAADIARRLRLDYLYVDREDDAAYPGVRKFDAHPDRFTRVFANDQVRIYKVM
jgi:hypothetical protein